MQVSARATREREQYDGGALKRERIEGWLSHANSRLYYEMLDDVRRHIGEGSGQHMLEIGSQCWTAWLENLHIVPQDLCCINISDAEMEKGRSAAATSRLQPTFRIMDAHAMEFGAARFDLVLGSAILHHLDLPTAVPEIARVLRPGGRILFAEPLDINPVSRLIRLITPRARTSDEQALRRAALRCIERHFAISVRTYQLFSLPASCLSVLLFPTDANPLMALAATLDRGLQRAFPLIKYYYRYALISGVKRESPV